MSLPRSDVLVIAEVAAAPDGWWGTVVACARAASESGADVVRLEPPKGLLEAPEATWVELRKAVLRLNLDFVTTVSSRDEVALFRSVGVGGLAAWVTKDAGEPLWDALGAARLPVYLLSSGSPDEDVPAALASLSCHDLEISVLFGDAERPTPSGRSGLSSFRGMDLGPRVARGFADRSGTGWAALAACTLGADVLELPISLSPFMTGPPGALGPEAFQRTVEGLRFLAWARAHG